MNNVRTKIKIDSFADKVLSIDTNDSNYAKKYNELFHSYLIDLEEILEKENIAFNVVALDFLYESNKYVMLGLVKTQNPKIMNALLILEKIRGIDASTIVDDLNKTMGLFYNGDYSHVDFKKFDFVETIYKELGAFLKGKEPVNKLQDDLTLTFYQNIETVIDELFINYRNHYLPRNNFIDKLFDLNDINTISKVFGLLEKMNLPSTYNYNRVILNNIQLLSSVKGLFKKCSHEVFHYFFQLGKKNFNELNQLFRKIIQLNKDDEEGIKCFFLEFKEECKHYYPLLFQLKRQGYYQKYANVDIDYLCKKNLLRFLNKDTNIDEIAIKKIGQHKEFIKHFDHLLQLFITSKSDKYKRKLILPLVVAAIEKEKKDNHLHFDIVFTSNNMNPREYGHYSKSRNILYINPLVFDYYSDLDYSLLESFNTLFHEVRHAKQYQEVKTVNIFDYDIFIQAIDFFLFEDESYDNYYTCNYEHISFERDAREIAYVKCMTIFKEYPKLLELSKKLRDKGNYPLSNYMRKGLGFSMEKYYGIIHYFIQEINSMFECLRDQKDYDLIKYYIKKIKEYPVFFQFLDFDEKNLILKVKSDEYFIKINEKVMKMPDSLKKRQMEYSLKAFAFGLKVGEYLQSKDGYMSFTQKKGYSDEIIEEVTNAVGNGFIK